MCDAQATPPRSSLRNTSVVFSEEGDVSLHPPLCSTLPNLVHRSSHSSDDTTSVVRFAELQDTYSNQLLLTPNVSSISPTLTAVPHHQLPPINTTQPSSFDLGEGTTNTTTTILTHKGRNSSGSSSRKGAVPTLTVDRSVATKKSPSARSLGGSRVTRAVSSSTPQPMSLNPLVHRNKKTVDRSSSVMEYRKPMLMTDAAPVVRTTSHGSVNPTITKMVSSDEDEGEDEYVQDEFGNWVPRKAKYQKTELEMRMERNSLEAVYANHINWCKKQASYLQRQRGPGGKLVRAPTTKPVEPALGRKRCASPATVDSSTNRMHSTSSGMDVEFEERFDDRLQHVHERNQDDWIEGVQDRRAAQMQEQLTTRQEAFQKREDRRNRIYDEIASASERKRKEEIGARGAQWTHLTCIAMLFVKWKQALHTQSAYAVYRRLLLPILQLRLYSARKAKARKDFIEENLPRNPRPGPDALTQNKEGFFTGWNDTELKLFLSLVKPVSFRAGEHIMHAGDYDRVMYIIMTGVVEIQIKKKGKDKRRCRENATCFPLKTPTYVGEFALLCREPRSASIQCTTDVNGWCIEFSDFEKVLKSLRPEQFDQLELATNDRRTQNLINYFPSQIDTLRSYAAFSLMPTEMLKAVNSAMTPHVLQRGHVVFNEGDYDPRFYIITDGELCITTPRSDPSAPPIAIGSGEAMGIFETFFLHESRKFTATVTRNCEMWSLTREALNDAGIIYPGVLQQCRGNIKDRLAERLAKDAFANASQLAQAAAMAASSNATTGPQRHNNKPPSLTVDSSAYSMPFSQFPHIVPVPRVLSSDPYIRHCFSMPSIYTAWHQVATPVVLASGDLLLDRGKPVSDIYIVVSGRIRTDYPTTNGLAKYNDDVVVDPHHRGAYSLRPPPINNLSSQFPLTPIIDTPEWRKTSHMGAAEGEGNASSAAELAAKRDKMRAAAPSATVIHLDDSTTEAGDDDLENSGLEGGLGSPKKKKAGVAALHSLRSLLRGYDCDFGGLYGTSNKAELTRQSMITAKVAILLGSNELCINGGLSQKTVTCVSKCVAWRINVERWLALTEQHPNALKDPKCQAYLASNQDSNIRSVLLTEPQYVKVHKAHLQHVADKEKAAIEAAHAAQQHRTVEQSGALLGVPHATSKSRSRGRSKPTGFASTKSGLSDRSSGEPTPTAESLRSRKAVRTTTRGSHDSPTPHTAPITLLLDDGGEVPGTLHPQQRPSMNIAVSAEVDNVSPTPSILEPIIPRSHLAINGMVSSSKTRSSSKKKRA